MSATGDQIRAQQAEADAITRGVRAEWEKFGSALSLYEKRSQDLQVAMGKTAAVVDTLVLPSGGGGTVIPPVPAGFVVKQQWDFQQPTLPAGWRDDGLTFNYGDRGDQKLDAVSLMRNVVYNPTKKCWELWSRKEDYPVSGSSGYWATAHYTACSINVEPTNGWLPGERVEIFARMDDQKRSCLWSSHGPDEFDFCEHFFSDAPQYNPHQSDHWADITSYSPVKQLTKVLPALIDGKPHTFWCDYLVDGANLKMGRDGTTTNTVPKASMGNPGMSHGIRVSEQVGGTWDGGYDAVQRGMYSAIQIPSAPSCTDLYFVRLLRKA